ncbi:MAG TPA: DUF1385 domain-containing protein [Gaiellaceae bacterium]|nr:DUF1385 domain-containing protein [Gaiellaceae bacterium]
MADEKIRLGGMALQNGVLVHGPTAWAIAVRTDDGELRVSSGRKRLRGAEVTNPLLRGPARLLDAMLLLPRIRRARPEARLPFERPLVFGSMVASAVAVRLLRALPRPGPVVKELLGGSISLLPATLALRGSSLAAYHGAEHISIGTYEHGEPRGKEHERCGSHLIGPLLVTSTLGAALAGRAPEPARGVARVGAAVGALAAATEVFSWMVRHPEHPVARALARPGHELQQRVATADPDPAQLEVAEAALQACLALETDGAQHTHRG